jgi:phosphate transport system permease protein
MTSKGTTQRIAFLVLRICAVAILAAVFLLIGFLVWNGAPVLNFQFLTENPREGMTAGGVFPAIVGTFYLTLLTLLFVLPLGIGAAIYLSEYADPRRRRTLYIIRTATVVLAGIPSIVYGLLGLGLFVLFLGLGFSLLSSALTLSFLTLPVIISASEEALRTVPMSYREGALALGATKWQVVRDAVLPFAVPGILTACVLGLARAAGETAPILLTGAAYYLPQLPRSVFQQFMALPFHIFILSTQSVDPRLTRPIQFGSVLVLLLLVLSLNAVAIVVRSRYRRKFRRMSG